MNNGQIGRSKGVKKPAPKPVSVSPSPIKKDPSKD